MAPMRSQAVEVALFVQALGALVGEFADVGAGGEGPVTGSGDHDDADRVVQVERLERLRQLGQEREAQRVARLRPIDRHERDAVMPLYRGIDADETGRRLDVGHADS